ncbi:MAG: hypothetical protein R2710_06020 [Acidimicrobiales bacterium]
MAYLTLIASSTSKRRPAHRPSRRNNVIDAAMGLFATMPVDVTVLDIASAVEMTPAAVCITTSRQEGQILIEGMERFAANPARTGASQPAGPR